MTESIADKLAKYVDQNPSCWLWVGLQDRRGYGMTRVDGRIVFAHRAAYEHWVGPIPSGLELDHLCRIHSCVNPAHLEPVTHAENVRRGYAGPQRHPYSPTHCAAGHERSEANTIVRANGERRCRVCRKAQDAAQYRSHLSRGRDPTT